MNEKAVKILESSYIDQLKANGLDDLGIIMSYPKDWDKLETEEQLKALCIADKYDIYLKDALVTVDFNEMKKGEIEMHSEEKIKKLLKLYGASDEEIKNFIEDLKKPEEAPSDSFDDDEPSPFDED